MFKIGQPGGLTLRFLLAGGYPRPQEQNQRQNQRQNQQRDATRIVKIFAPIALQNLHTRTHKKDQIV